MLDQLTPESFHPYLNQTFRIQAEPAGSLDLTLAECSETGQSGRSRPQFQVLFIGPVTPVLPQKIYRLVHEQMGALDLFLVPIGPDGRGMRYQAVFT
ncbi:MAG TPA: hypothetical protein VER03_20660 [Bryobacteraceae bacterium]|nr:hypothetical protein [Bryobacteraceae bacterium]